MHLHHGDGQEDNLATGKHASSINGLVVEYIVAIDVTRARFPADAYYKHSVTTVESNLTRTCKHNVSCQTEVACGHARIQNNATPVGFEPTRGDPIGLAGRRLSHSAKVSMLLTDVCL